MVGKLFGLGASLLLLGLLGSGTLDRWLSPRPAFARSHDRRAPPALSSLPVRFDVHAPAPAASASLSSPSASAASVAASAAASDAHVHGASAARTADGKVILNLAAEADLAGLPGVGPKKAKAIIELRAKLGGRFKRLEELMRVRGIKRKFLERIKPHVVLDAPG